jgi:hypothetical protein
MPALKIVDSTAFYNCSSLVSLELSSLQKIGNSAFYNCTSLNCNNFVFDGYEIGERAFYNCYSLSGSLTL